MNKLYLITTATQHQPTAAHLLHDRLCVFAATELEAAAIALSDQPDDTYIFKLEIYYPKLRLKLNRAKLAPKKPM